MPLSILEMISNILGDTNDGLTGSEIHKFLLESQIKDISEGEFLSKKKRLYNAFTKLLQKSEMRKDIVIELSYKGFSCASDYS